MSRIELSVDQRCHDHVSTVLLSRLSIESVGGPEFSDVTSCCPSSIGKSSYEVDTICRYRPVLEFLVEKALEPFCAHLNESIV